MFREILQAMVDGCDGARAAVLMGFDGIAIDSYATDPSLDVASVGMEFSFLVSQMVKAAGAQNLGEVSEVCLRADGTTLVMRVLSDDYFVAVALSPEGNFGKARYLVRLNAPRLQAEL